MSTDITQAPGTTTQSQEAAMQQQITQAASAQQNPNQIQVHPGSQVDPAVLAQAQAAANAAAAQNEGWRNNTLPILPTMGIGSGAGAGGSSSMVLHYNPNGSTTYISSAQDAANEAAKHAAAFNPINYGNFANVPLSQIASQYGTSFADRVQGYYTEHPTQQFQDINAQYGLQQARTIGDTGVMQQRAPAQQNPFNPNSAAGIAWEVNRTGGTVGMTLGGTSFAEGYNPMVSNAPERSTVPIRDLSTGMLSGGNLVAALSGVQTTTTYVPYGEFAQIKLENTKDLIDYNTGELGVYQQATGTNVWNLIAGGGRNALQSGMFTVGGAETPYVISQYSTGTAVLPSGVGMSRLGSEAYAGWVRQLDNRTIQPFTPVSQYANANNLADYVNPLGPNMGKAAAPGANIPWSVSPNAPAIQYMNENGVIPGAVNVPGVTSPVNVGTWSTISQGHLVGGGMVASQATLTDNLMQEKSNVVSTVMRPSGTDIWAMNLNIPYLSGAIVAANDFFFGGRTMETTTRGQPSNLPGSVGMGVPVQTITAVPGGYEVTTTTTQTTTGGTTTPYTTISTPILSGFAYGESQFAKQVTMPLIPQLSYRDTGNVALNYLEAGGIGLTQGIREKPLTAAVYAGAGVLMAAGGEVIAGLGAATIEATAGTSLAPIAVGANWFATTAAPIALTTLYGADVIGRTTAWGKDLSPAAAQRFGEITSTEILPMLAGGAAFAYRGAIAGTARGAYESLPSFNDISTGISDRVYQYQQGRMGIKNVGAESGLSFYQEPYEPTFMGSAKGEQPFAFRVEGPSGVVSSSTEVVPVKFTRESFGAAYDITRTNLQYSPDVQSVMIDTNRDIITQGNYGKIMAAQKSSAMTIDVGEYARATGIDLITGNKAATGFVDVYKIETLHDVYPSGMVYENVVGRKGTIEVPGRETAGVISSRGIAYGQGTIERNAMAMADDILNNAIARAPAPSRISSTDLPTIIKDMSSGFGSINVESAAPVAASVDVTTMSTRITRASTPLEQIFGEHAIQNADVGAKLGVNLPGGAKGEQLSSLFETLPNYGVTGSEVISSYQGTPLKPVTSGGYTFDVNAGIKDILFGEHASAFESEAMRLRENAGIEKVRRPYDINRKPITPLSKTFGKQKPAARAKDIGAGPLKQIAAVSNEFVKAETERIGRGIETILGQSQRQTSAQGVASGAISGSQQDALAPWQGRNTFVEEEFSNLPSAESLRKTGISERAGFKEPYRGRVSEGSIIDMVAARGLRTGLMTRVIQGTQLAQVQRERQQTDIASMSSIMSDSMVISKIALGQNTRLDTMQDVMRDTENIFNQNEDTRQQQDVITGFKQITDQTQKIITDTRFTTRPDITTTYDIWRIPPPDIPKFPLGGLGSGGGGAGIFGDILRTHKRNYSNPVVDIEYLSGMYAAPAGMGRGSAKKGSSAPVRLLTGQLRSSAKHQPKKGKK